jgi:hypothetical protein
MHTTIRLELRHSRKAWPGTPVGPSLLSGETNIAREDVPARRRSPSWSDQLPPPPPKKKTSTVGYNEFDFFFRKLRTQAL